MKRLLDSIWQVGYKVAYHVFVLAHKVLRFQVSGVFVMIWYEDQLLVLQNSYKRWYSFPGGLLKKHEDPAEGGVRETLEEVGIVLQTDQLTQMGMHEDELGGCAYFYDVELESIPEITIDDREVTWAGFMPLSEVFSLTLNPTARTYLLSHPNAKDHRPE